MSNAMMVDQLIQKGYLKTPRIIEAFRAIDRADFVLPEVLHCAYTDVPLPIGYGQTISQPSTVALMLEHLQPQAGDRVLDIGFGSGWTTALLAHITKKGQIATVFAVEHLPGLYELGRKNLKKYATLTDSAVQTYLQNGLAGIPQFAPFQKILASASAEKIIPQAWRDQLMIGGTIVAPVKESLWKLDRRSQTEWAEHEYHGFAFVPLVSETPNTL